MHFENGFSILFNLYITQDLICADLPVAALCFVEGTSIGYANCLYDCFKAEVVTEFRPLTSEAKLCNCFRL